MIGFVKKIMLFIRDKRLTPVVILLAMLLTIFLFVFFTEGTVFLPAIYSLIP